MDNGERDVVITGVGLASSLGVDAHEHVARLADAISGCVVEEIHFAPYCVHPLVPLDFSRQIPKKSDLKQMETWQRIGVYAAGLALADAGVAENFELLEHTHLVVAAGSGERDIAVDCEVLDKLDCDGDSTLLAKQVLPSALRPTLFLAQLSNMLAGNISIVHGVTGSSRTFMGEEMAGLTAIENAYRRIVSRQTDIVLVGGALNSEREDLLLGLELGHNLWRGPYAPVWDRARAGGGLILGSVGAFLVLEAREHAMARGARTYARLVDVVTGRCDRGKGSTAGSLTGLYERLRSPPKGPLCVLSGASGVEPETSEESEFIQTLPLPGAEVIVRAFGSALGHSVEAHFPAGLALAALIARHKYLPPALGSSLTEQQTRLIVDNVLVTCVGHWRGEGLAVIEATT